ncbi:universal stress protein [Natrarchaeobius sp. A-rgal3]|uniref:universal stress protein n=1 Tax=Natrarchaeobius versutus TaxID=1679078 RepID=UPI00350FAE40
MTSTPRSNPNGDRSPADEQKSPGSARASEPTPKRGEEGLFDRILAAVADETDRAVLEVAGSLAAEHGARLDALSIVRMSASVDHWDVVVERREDEAESVLDAVGELGTTDHVDVTKSIRYGEPATEIERYAEGNGVDLVVVGDNDKTGLERFLSPCGVAERLRRSASIPVLTVPPSDRPTQQPIR